MSFPRYPAYKDSGVEYLGVVPDHWQISPLKFLTRIGNGSTPSRERPDYWTGAEGFPWLNSSVVNDDPVAPPDQFVTAAALAECHLPVVSAPAVLVGITGQGRTRGMATTLLFDATVSQHVAFLLAQNERLVLPFLRLALEMAYPFLRRDSEAGGSTKGAITCEELGNFKIAFPRQDEQRSIVAFCAVEAAKIDALVAEQERLIELLKEKRQIVISHAVTKGLNPAAPMKDSGIEWLGQVPAHWSALRLRWLYRQQKRQGFQHLPVLSVYRDYGVILKDSRSDNINKTPEDVSAYQLVAPGDLVVNKMKAWQGSLGVSTLEGITSPDYAVFTPLLPHHGAFLHHLLRSQAIVTTYRGLSSGIRPDQWRLEPDAFLGLSIYLPSIEEQKAIAEHIVASAGKFDALMEEAERAVILLQERRAALISAAVTGQIDVRNQGVVSAA